MSKIKIISDPYNRKISYEMDKTGNDEWEKIELNLDSKLREYDEEKIFLPFNK